MNWTSFLTQLIGIIAQVFTILIIIQVILSYFLDPYHRVRLTIDRMIEPFLAPIRQILPQTGGIDFSPLVLLIIVYLVSQLLISLLNG